MYQVANALAFSDITDEDVNLIEKFVREDLNDLLEKHQSRELNLEEKSAFFGIYAGCPEKFNFLGSRKLIRQMVQHVQSKLQDSPNCFEQSEEPPNKKRKYLPKGTVQTSIGLVFGNSKVLQSTNSQAQPENSHDSMTASLFRKAKQLFQTYEEDAMLATGNPFPAFSEKMINVNFNEVNDIKAIVTCQFCERESKVYLKRSGTGFSWTLSNLKTHIKNCLKIKKPTRAQGDEHECDTSGIEIVPLGKVPHKNRNSNKAKNEALTTVELKIEPNISSKHDVAKDDSESDLDGDIFTQISHQNIKMTNTAAKHKEIKKRCKVDVDGTEYIDVCVVNGDGNCAFSVIAHQMFHAKVNSPEHVEQTQKLRADVVQYIKQHLSLFTHEIKGRLYEQDKNTDEFDADCDQFLEELSQEGFYGGNESLKAIILLHKINIMIFNENGPCYFVYRFKLENEITVMMAFRGSGSNTKRDHYDSVIGIKNETLKTCVDTLFEKEMQYAKNKNSKDVVVVS